ncbi:type II toxin-antitoxin system RelE/ParE family toxin [Paraglaciecola arctica]|uniref:Toxin n=1 Tax=Paraglaciecola arctica BSs20135 TaxID=493475 RepID=K6YSG9_9ALTE|nr:hypothetical protein GARC_2672 [Paraglaciecola arctica BSs20135]
MPNSYTNSKQAEKDINHITKRSMADFGEVQTDKYLEGLAEALIKISLAPKLGRRFIHGETQQTYLYYRYISHIIYYRERKNDIFIIRILHTKMLPKKHL